MRESVATIALLAALGSPLAAQATRDRPTLIFTISGAYLGGIGLWNVPDQPVDDASAGVLTDHFNLGRSVKRTFGAGLSGTYYRGAHLGLSGEAFLMGLGYSDHCRLAEPVQSELNLERCESIEGRDRSAAAVTLSTGIVYRVAADDFASPFVRLAGGILINSQSPLLMVGETRNGAELVIYNDDHTGTRIRPAFAVGAGASMAVGRGYQVRWEVRDNIVGISRVTGTTDFRGGVPPHETAYKHIFSASIGIDIILEKRHGRRY